MDQRINSEVDLIIDSKSPDYSIFKARFKLNSGSWLLMILPSQGHKKVVVYQNSLLQVKLEFKKPHILGLRVVFAFDPYFAK